MIHNNRFYVKVTNMAVREMLAELCKTTALKTDKSSLDPHRLNRDYFVTDDDEGRGAGFAMHNCDGKLVTLEKMVEMLEKQQPNRLKLNEDYEAIVEDGEVKVGCQTFSADKVLELAEMVKNLLKKA